MIGLNKNLIIIFGLLVLAGLSAVYLVYPSYKNINELNAEAKKQEIELSQQEAMAKKVDSLFEEYSAQDPKKIDLIQNKIIPFSLDIPQLLIQLEALTSENGLIMKNIGFSTIAPAQKAQAPGQAKEVSEMAKSAAINLSLEGSYESFKNFLREIETNSRLIDASSISFSSPGLSADQIAPIFNFSLSLKTYFK